MNPLNHAQARRCLQAAADNRLEASQRSALEEHLAACSACRHYAEQIGILERNLRRMYHKQWDAASDRSINLLPNIRAGYRRRMTKVQLLSLANTLVTIGVVVGLLLVLNWFLSTYQAGQPAGDLTPTPSTPVPATASPTPTVSAALTNQLVITQPPIGNPAGTLAFVSSSVELGDLYLIHVDGSGQTRMFDDNLSLSLSPTWSPDGTKLAFVSARDGNNEIYTVNADGTQWVRLTDNPAEDTHPVWSPDGKSIAFASDRTGYSEVYVMDTNGLNVTQLTHTQASNTHPTWSPDGAFIAFATNRDGYWQIYRMKANGYEPVNLSNNLEYDDKEPAWSPDGQWIVFASQPITTPAQEIYVMNADGSGRARLTVSVSSHDKPTSDYSPVWSPDSQWIAFCSNRDNKVYGDIYIIPAGSKEVEAASIIRLTTQGGSHPAWKP